MRARLTLILVLGSAVVAAAQSSTPAPGSVPELPPIGLPLPQIGLPHPATGLPPPQPRHVVGARQQQRPPAHSRRGPWLPAAIYFIPPYVVPAVPETPAVEAPPPTGRLRVDIEPDVVGQVYLDGYYVGSTGDLDSAMEVTTGRHSIEIRADGYQPLQDDIAVGAGRSVTYRGVLARPVPEPAAAPAAAADVSIPAQKPGSTTFYVIPGCYMGNVPPEDTDLPEGCDPRRAITIKR